jgi:hypothetical protein
MNPELARLMFNFGVIILLMGLIPLPFLDVKSPEFVVDIAGLIIDLIFLAAVAREVRKQH